MTVEADGAGFGGAVQLADDDTIPFVEAAAVGLGEGSAGREDDPKAREIDFATRRGLAEKHKHLRDAAEECYPFPRDPVEHLAAEELGDRVESGADVKRRHHRSD